MRRPSRIFLIGVAAGTPFDSGNYAYDGSGNLTNFDGVWEQTYDPLNRAADCRPTSTDPAQWAAIYTASDEWTRRKAEDVAAAKTLRHRPETSYGRDSKKTTKSATIDGGVQIGS